MRKNLIELGAIESLQILDAEGRADEAFAPQLADDELLKIHRAMVLTRTLDLRMLAMQRQGEMGTFAPGLGQEATQIGQVQPLLPKDWFVPSYRSFGAQLWRGWTIEGLMRLWAGVFWGFEWRAGAADSPCAMVVVPRAFGGGFHFRHR